jgi:RNA polymerase sigma-70 factor (ECF subfamily)
MHHRDRGLSRPEFTALYAAEAEGLLVFLTRRTLQPDTALDLWSETLAQAFAGRRRYRGEADQAPAWLYAIAYRQLAMFWRRGAVERRALQRLGLERPAPTETQLEQLVEAAGLEALKLQLGSAMDELPKTQRDAVRLRVVDELSYAEVARRLGLREDAARARVSRALRSLAVTLSHRANEVTEVVG